MTPPPKEYLYDRGRRLAEEFCEKNSLTCPEIVAAAPEWWNVSACAYYRPETINICINECAPVGLGGPAWSWPGYVIDRTPYGVIAHELGHHIDWLTGTDKGAYWSDFSIKLRAETKEEKITNYCPNDAEWFAEIFRLFITNPDLLREIRPKTYAALVAEGFTPVVNETWDDVLWNAPERTRAQAQKKIDSAFRLI